MEGLFLIGGIVALVLLWQRVKALEARVHQLEDQALPVPEMVRSAPSVTRAPPAPEEASPEPQAEPKPEPAIAQGAEPEPVTAQDLAPEPEPEPEPEPVLAEEPEPEPQAQRRQFDFEDIFGRQLPIWGGGIALAIAGFFLVRWSIEAGLLNETVRVALGFGFGTLLLVAAEVAHRFNAELKDERVRQAFAGAGLATLYASFYLAGTHYALIGPAAAFAGLAGVTALAIALSYRFGLPSAVLGLVGGFAAPALAGASEPNLPLLATYLAMVTGGLVATGKRQQRPWLGLAALGGALGWGLLMLLGGTPDDAAVLAIGSYLVLIGAMLPALLGHGPLGKVGRLIASALAALQVAALVDLTGYSLLAWGCYVLLAGALAILGVRFDRVREASGFAALVGASLLAAWPDAPAAWFAAITAALALILAGVPLWHAWREHARAVDWGQVALVPPALLAAACWQFAQPLVGTPHILLALAAAALALLPALGAVIAWPKDDRPLGIEADGTLASAAALLLAAAVLATPAWAATLASATVAAGLFALLRGRKYPVMDALLWAVALTGLAMLLSTTGWEESQHLIGDGDAWSEWRALLRWAAAAMPFVVLALPANTSRTHAGAEVFAALLGYGALAMVLDWQLIPALLTAAVLAITWRLPQRVAASRTWRVLGVAWALPVLVPWIDAGLASLGGLPFLASALPPMADVLRMALPLAVALVGVRLLRPAASHAAHVLGWSMAGLVALVVVHSGFKQLFDIADLTQFAASGLAERTIWQALLALLAVALTALPARLALQARAAKVIALAALAHFALFGLLLHNPLLGEQAVGAWPVANWLLPSYGIAVALVLWLRRDLAGMLSPLRPVLDGVVMALIALLALSELRHAFSGTMLAATPMSQTEDLLRSLLAIVLALGFLGWGAWMQQRSWRVGSLVLMLGAVFKVFVFDAAGLEGLARVASFLALGLCLIGIGWFYSRQLIARTAPQKEAAQP